MGVARRIAELWEAKINAWLNRIEDPREMVDYSHAQQQELLGSVRRGMLEVAAGARRAAEQASGLDGEAARLQDQAEQAVAAGQDDLARQALARRGAVLARAGELRDQETALHADQEKLAAVERRLQAKIDEFGFRKEAIKADYTAARLTAEVSGISEEMSEAGLARRRAADRTAQVHARADALGDMLAPGGPADAMFPVSAESAGGQTRPGDLSAEELQSRLDDLATQATVDAELAQIKARLARDQ